jgi:hypothetical protein
MGTTGLPVQVTYFGIRLERASWQFLPAGTTGFSCKTGKSANLHYLQPSSAYVAGI